MKILAIDLGKNKSVFVDYVTGAAEPTYGKIGTNACEVQKLLERSAPDRLVIEAGPASGWVHDLAEKLGIPVQVANGNDERWHWKAVKHKTDRADALKLAQLSEMNSLPTVHVPTAIKNSIRAIYERQGLMLPSAKAAWTQAAVEELTHEAEEGAASAIWLLQVQCELQQLQTVQTQIQQIEAKLAELGKANPAVQRLQTAPYVGPRLSEAVVAILDDPHRFGNSRQVGCYAGLTPRQWQSGQSDRQGHISKAGNKLLRKLLTEIAWLGVRNKTWMLQVFENVRRGSDKRKKIAIVAVARRLLVKLWAMLRDGTEWMEDKISVNQSPSVAATGAT
jgi:transposase